MAAWIKKIALPTAVLIWAATYFVEVMGYSEKNSYLIKPVFMVMVVLYIVNTITDVIELKKEKGQQTEKMSAEEKEGMIKAACVVAGMAVYIAAMPHLGFIIATALLVAVLLLIMQVKKPIPLIILPVVLTCILYVVFKICLKIPLPVGILKL